MIEQRVGFVGAGQMAQALARGFVQAGLIEPSRVIAYDPVPTALDNLTRAVQGVRRAGGNRQVVEESDVVFLAVKPQHMNPALADLRPAVASSKLFVSIAAGITIARLCDSLGMGRVIRVMPNTPCLVGRGAAGFALGPAASQDDGKLTAELLSSIGLALPVDESLLDAVTGLSGSGPAFVYVLIEAMADAGVRVGLPRATAALLAAHTFRGAAEMVIATGDHPAVLKDRVASPGGTTIAGLEALESQAGRAAMMAAVVAATRRSQELGNQ
ncbi:MAG: pyrroline-5-carboxylate reductase [Pirellulales bacterium]